MSWPKLLSCVTALLILASGLTYVSHNAGAAPGFIEDMSSPAHTYRGAEWHKDGIFMLSVGDDTSGNGVIDRYHSDDGVWETLHSFPGDSYNGIEKTETFLWYDGIESGLNGWTTSVWSGGNGWHQINPSTIPNAPSGTSHGQANNGDHVWWFGNDATGAYADGANRVAGSMYTPIVDIPDISSNAAIVFWHWFDVQNDAIGNNDRMTVSIKNDTDIVWHQLARWDSRNISSAAWRQELIMINGWLGNRVQLNFTFDSWDGVQNDFAGWHIDDFLFYSNEMYIVVGEPGPGGYSAYAVDGYGVSKNIGGMDLYDFNDVAPGKGALTFMAVGDSGAALYYNGYSWQALTGPDAGDVLTAVDFNGTHFFIVGYDSSGKGVAYYYMEGEFYVGQYGLHPIWNTPDWKLNDIDWSNEYPTMRGTGLGAVAAEGSAVSLSSPETWYPIPTAQAPSARVGHAMAYDPVHDVIVLFGGYDGTALDDTWIFSLATRSWSQVFPASPPSARRYHEMVYDSASQRMILFGGYPFTGDTWSYDYSLNAWSNMNPAASPTQRCYHAMAYDPITQKTLLFGGFDGTNLDDTWIYDFGTNLWSPQAPAQSPTARCNSGLAYDSANRRFVLFGGSTGSLSDETWTYDMPSDTWTLKDPAVKPPATGYHSMTYDTVSGQVLMFGGSLGAMSSDDTWAYRPASDTWVNLFPCARPQERKFTDLAYDSNRGQAILFGGDYNTYSGDTWLCIAGTPWNGNVVDRAIGMNGENLTAVAWDNSGRNAVFAGHNTTHAVLYRFYYGKDYLALVPNTASLFAGHEFHSVSYKPLSATDEVVLLGASAFMIHPAMSDSGTRLTATVETPQVFNIDFRDASSGLSMENTQADADGVYTFYIEANYTLGGTEHWNDASIAIAAWYDEGHTGIASVPDPTWLSPVNRTRQLGINYDVGLGAAVVSYPVAPNLEFILDSFWEDPTTYPGSRHRVYINVSFGEQTWAADGAGFVAGAASDGFSRSLSFNDPYSWDYAVHVYDTLVTDAYTEAYEEFGIKKSVSITATGNPSGNAPPGTALNPMTNPSLITYSSNAPYWVNVSVPNLGLNGDPLAPDNIPATDVFIANANILASPEYTELNATDWPTGRAFTGPDAAWCVWGNRTAAGNEFMPSPLNGTHAFGPWGSDYNLYHNPSGTTQLDWWVTVQAGKPEGMYWGIISVTIDN